LWRPSSKFGLDAFSPFEVRPVGSEDDTPFLDILILQGVWGLWRGTGPTCIRVGLGAGLYFLMLDRVMAGMRKLHETRLQTAQTNRVMGLMDETSGRQSGVAPMQGKPILMEDLIQPSERLVETEPSTSGRESLSLDKASAKLQADAGRGLPALYTVTAGAVTRSTAAALLCPITVVKTRMEVRSASLGCNQVLLACKLGSRARFLIVTV
jgi:hypothetical protein